MNRLWIVRLALAGVLLVGHLTGPVAPALAAPQPAISRVVPLLSVFGALAARNRVYRDAEHFITEQTAYYDGLRETARAQLTNRTVSTLRPSQLAAYVKLVQAIEQERAGVYAIAESVKGAARQEFNQRLQNAITSALLGSGPAQKLLGAMRRGITSAQDGIGAALEQLSGAAGGPLAQVARVREIAGQVNLIASNIGGPTGQSLRRVSDRILKTIDRVTEPIEADLRKVSADLEGLEQAVDQLQEVGRSVNGSVSLRDVAARVVDPQAENPTLDAIVKILTRDSVDASNLRQQADEQLRQGFVVRCVAKAGRILEAIAALEGGPTTTQDQLLLACQTMEAAGPAPEAPLAEVAGDVQLTGRIDGLDEFAPYVETNQLSLGLTGEGGPVEGAFQVVINADYGFEEDVCLVRLTYSGSMAGDYDPIAGSLSGTIEGFQQGLDVLQGCADSTFENDEAWLTWTATFDPSSGHLSGQLVVSGEEGSLPLTFVADVGP